VDLTDADQRWLKAARDLALLTKPQAVEVARDARERRARGEPAADLGRIAAARGYMDEAGRRAVESALGAGSPFAAAAAGLDADAFDLIEGYEIVERVGEGAFATVYRARSRASGKEVALKVFSPAVQKEEHLDRFLREVRAIVGIAHQNVVQVIDAGKSRGRHYLVLEYVPAPDLGKVVEEQGPLPEREVLAVARDAAAALGAVAAVGIVHRDVKPENLIRREDGVVKLCDLGLAYEVGGEPTAAGSGGEVRGTVTYLSPEQVLAKEPDLRSDLYALGATLFFLATGEPPFKGATAVETARAHLQRPPPSPREKRPELSEGFAALVLRLLEKDPARRPQTAAQVEAGAEKVQAGEVPWPPLPPAPPEAPTPPELPLPAVAAAAPARRRISRGARLGAGVAAARSREQRFALAIVAVAIAVGLLVLLLVALSSSSGPR